MNIPSRSLAFLLVCGITFTAAQAQTDYFSNWPEGVSPQVVGKRVAEHFITSPHQGDGTIFYGEVGTWYGALTFAQLTHDDALRTELIHKFEPLMPGGPEAARIPIRHHVDDSIFGVVPLEIGIQTRDAKFLAYGQSWADRQWENPQPDGLSAETRYWIDDMYMLTILQLEAFRATGDKKYLDRDAAEMVSYLDKLQQPNGLFYHAPDVPYFWGRGDGWVAAGMAEMLRTLPPDHPQRARIMAGYKKMMAALLEYQGKDGMWRQLIDRDDAWPESSGSAMFTFAMISGVKNGWLPAETYGPAARRAWIAVAGYIDQNNDVVNVCEGTGKKNELAYYYARKRKTGDFHGQAPVLWAASALLRLTGTMRTRQTSGWVASAAAVLCAAAALFSGCRNNLPQELDHPRGAAGVRMQDVTFFSAALGRDMPYRVYLPETISPGKKLPVVYLLHGGNGGFRDFSNFSDVSQFALARSTGGLILVMPEGEFSYWFNAVGKPQDRFQDYVTSDLLADVEARFPAARDRDHRAVIGNSMGGWAAIKLALDHPELYGFAAGISPAIEATHRGFSPLAIGQWLRLKEIFGPGGGPVRVANDPFELVKTADPAKTPFLYITSGESEPLLVPIRRFVGQLERRHFAYTFATKPGGHDWGEWDSQLPGCFDALEKHLGS